MRKIIKHIKILITKEELDKRVKEYCENNLLWLLNYSIRNDEVFIFATDKLDWNNYREIELLIDDL